MTTYSKIKNQTIILLVTVFSTLQSNVNAQTEMANLVIDSVNMVFKGNSSFPYWLKTGQTLDVGPNTATISVLEFIIDSANGNNLKFSQVLSVKSSSKVPTSRTWKIESVAFLDNAIVGTKPAALISPFSFTTPGTYTWIVPDGVGRICIELWGGGGSGANGDFIFGGGGGGGGGGYGYACYTVLPKSSHIVIVGAGGGTSSFDGTLLFSTGGSKGSSTSGGNGGTSNGTILKIDGLNAADGVSMAYSGWSGPMGGGNGGSGGSGGNGGSGGSGGGNPLSTIGKSPGGGGGGGGSNNSTTANYGGSSGGLGKVTIYW